jgi:pimeloyl-ACP methyl ester carboxylesterase
MVGEEDDPFLRVSKETADTIPGAEIVVIEDAGHSPQFENPDAWFAALSGFLGRVQRRSDAA